LSPQILNALKKKATAARAAVSPAQRGRNQRARFWDEARRYSPVIAVEDRRGNRVLVDTSDVAIGREVFLERGFDSQNVDAVLDCLREFELRPEQIIDVGANIGTVTLDLLACFPDAVALAFEPDEINVRLLRQNVMGNDLSDRVTVYEAAVSDHDGEATFEISPSNPGDHRVRIGAPEGEIGEERWATRTVPVMRLDTLVDDTALDPQRPTLLWIDAQGHEAQILQGASRLRGAPTVVEFWPYGLRRAGGYDTFLAQVRAYASIREIRGGVRHISSAELDTLGRDLEARKAFTDLLLLPHR